MAEHGVAEDVDVLHALILHEVGEPLFLHARHIENVGIGNLIFGELSVFYVADIVLGAVLFVLVGHGELLGRDEMEGGVEMAHGHDEGVHGAPVFEVAHEVDVEVVEGALCLVDAVEVE